MGRKRTRKRKHLYLSIAGLIILSVVGCVELKPIEVKREIPEHFITAQNLIDQGDYEGALQENQKVFLLYDSIPPGDEALFNMGLIYVHYGYPKRDYRRSLDLFKRLVKVFPQSPLAGQAKIWIAILKENERLNKKIQELKTTIKKSKQVDIEIDRKKKELSK